MNINSEYVVCDLGVPETHQADPSSVKLEEGGTSMLPSGVSTVRLVSINPEYVIASCFLQDAYLSNIFRMVEQVSTSDSRDLRIAADIDMWFNADPSRLIIPQVQPESSTR